MEAQPGPYLTYFKAQQKTLRFRLNQRVYITSSHEHHLELSYQVKSHGRYVQGTISKSSKIIGPIYILVSL